MCVNCSVVQCAHFKNVESNRQYQITAQCRHRAGTEAFVQMLSKCTSIVAGAKRFSKLDAKNGYWQIPLEEESQLLTTFSTPFGRYCDKEMMQIEAVS